MTSAGMACSACGTALRDGAKFCDSCGSRVVPSTRPAEYKQVTVLFADVVRSMDIAAVLDPEQLRTLMTDVVERMAAVVRRYGGTAEYNGDGVMALFGAPIALEDHAFRACMAALDIQREAGPMPGAVARQGPALQLRVGLNSGQVIAGDIGSGSLGYAATGEDVGMAQRMESVAPPGGVMLSESTARLVEHLTTLGEPEQVRIKGFDDPVCARQLLAIRPPSALPRRTETRFVGRRLELATLAALLDRAGNGRGGVVNVIGPPGIGKSRVAREAAALARERHDTVHWTFCEAHSRDGLFGVATRLLRSATGVDGRDDAAARARVRELVPEADPQDLQLLDGLLGIPDPEMPSPQIDPDAWRRRLTALIGSLLLVNDEPALFIVEDAHWIDVGSESLLAEVLAAIHRTRAMMLITARPEYAGALRHTPGSQTIVLAPLVDSDVVALLAELLGPHPSVRDLAVVIADRAVGNPFFAEEIVRELAQRDVLTGARGDYACRAEVDELRVPATVQATIEARIDRLSAPAKRTLTAASVIGMRFDAELLAALGIDAVLHELLAVELIDQIRFLPHPEYVFHHPLIHAVAYESQLRSDRADWHRRLATAIQQRAPESVDENAALIAEHLRAAGELHTAYNWHLRAAGWSTSRDVDAARLGWRRAKHIADSLPSDEPGRLSMLIAPLTMLCTTDWMARGVDDRHGHFDELRELCNAAGDTVSLAIGMTGLAAELLYNRRAVAGSKLASEQMALLESIGDPNLTIGLSFVAFTNWFNSGDFAEILRWSQNAIDLAGGDPTAGAGFGMGAPLAVATAFRSIARWWLGLPGWRADIDDALIMSSISDQTTHGLAISWTYGVASCHGVFPVDDAMIQTIEAAARFAERAGNDTGFIGTQLTLGMALLRRDSDDDRLRGLAILTQILDTWLSERTPSLVPVVELFAGRERAIRGDRGTALPVMRAALDGLFDEGRYGWCVCGTATFVEALLHQVTGDEPAEAEKWIRRLADIPAAGGAMLDITVLRLRTLLARARGDDDYHALLEGYRDTAKLFGLEGHIAWAGDLTSS